MGALPLFVKRTDGAFWRVHDFRFLEGGPYGDQDDADGRAVAVISESARNRMYAGAPALGRTFDPDGRAFRIAGVVKDVPVMRFVPFAEAWMPLGTLPARGSGAGLMGNMMAGA